MARSGSTNSDPTFSPSVRRRALERDNGAESWESRACEADRILRSEGEQ